MPKGWWLVLITTSLLFFSPKPCFAEIYINEFSSSGSNDWVEFYRTGNESIALYEIKDEIEQTKPLAPAICVGSYCTIDWDNLNQGGDIIKLFLISNPGDLVDQVAYGDSGDDVNAPGSGQSAGRTPDGSDNFIVFDTPSQGSANPVFPTATPTSEPIATFTPTPSPTPSLTATPTSRPDSATYQINEVKDESDVSLNSVKVYVDDIYIHHYVPETLTFCDDCYCDDDEQVSCSFGEHVIRLEKSGYQDWNQTKTISAGDNYEVDPVMEEIGSAATSTPTPKPTATPTKKLTPTPTPKLSPTPTPTPEKEATVSGKILGEEKEEGEEIGESGGGKKKILAGGLISLGGGLVVFASFWGKKKTNIDFDTMEEDEQEA